MRRSDPPVSVADVLTTQPQSKTCSACGRTYALRYTVLGWEQLEPSRRDLSSETGVVSLK